MKDGTTVLREAIDEFMFNCLPKILELRKLASSRHASQLTIVWHKGRISRIDIDDLESP